MMNTKQFIFLILLFTGITDASAQSYAGLSVATSKNDRHVETLWFQQQFSPRFSAGIQLRNSGINYRFVNARAVESGNTRFAGLVLGFRLKETESYRFDLNLTTSYRYLKNTDRPELPSSTNGLEVDPNIIFGLRLSDKVLYHAGAMMRTAYQFGPEPIGNEQLPSAIVLNAISIQQDIHSFSLRTYFGPMNGATGDTEKFFWQISLGYQIQLKQKSNSGLPFFNF